MFICLWKVDSGSGRFSRATVLHMTTLWSRLRKPPWSCICTTWNMQPPGQVRQKWILHLECETITSAYNPLAKTDHTAPDSFRWWGSMILLCPREENKLCWWVLEVSFTKTHLFSGFYYYHLFPIFAVLVITVKEIHSVSQTKIVESSSTPLKTTSHSSV